MYEDIKQFCVTCTRCGLPKPLATECVPLKSIHTSEPLELVCLDFLPLDKSKGGVDELKPQDLCYAEFSLPFILQTDASTTGVGAALTQMQDGKERVVLMRAVG